METTRPGSVLHLRRTLRKRPQPAACPDVAIRPFAGTETEVEAFLALRHRAFRGLEPPVRPWSRDEFRRQLIARPWWDPGRCLLAWATDGQDQWLAGSAVLAIHALKEPVAAVCWLMVAPEFRRRGLGQTLLAHLEQIAWDQGVRHVRVETHSGWKDAVQFYFRQGYLPCSKRTSSPHN